MCAKEQLVKWKLNRAQCKILSNHDFLNLIIAILKNCYISSITKNDN